MKLYETFQCANKGTALRATRNIRRGETVIFEEPYAFAVKPEHRKNFCEGCAKQSDSLKACSACKVCFYCSVTCQRRAWKMHKHECRQMKSFPRPTQLSDLSVILNRVFIKLNQGDDGSCSGGESRSVFDLVSNYDRVGFEEKILMASVLKKAQLLYSSGGSGSAELPAGVDSAGEALQLLGRLKCNSFATSIDDISLVYGLGIYLAASCFNHACAPNCEQRADGCCMKVTALRDVAAGEELTITYIELPQLAVDRQEDLSSGYYFQCQCALCVTADDDAAMTRLKDGTTQMSPDEVAVARRFIRETKAMNRRGARASVFTRAQDFLAKEEPRLAADNIFVLLALELLFSSCTTLQRWNMAIESGLRLVPLLQMRLGGASCSSNLGLHCFDLGKLLVNEDRLLEACGHLQEALKHLRVTHGGKSKLTGEVEWLLQNCHRELSA